MKRAIAIVLVAPANAPSGAASQMAMLMNNA
jgi:hypothetical protein